MYSDWGGPAIAGFLALWLGGLTYFVWQQNRFFKSLFPKSGERDIRRKFEELLTQTFGFRQDLDNLKGRLSGVEEFGLKHIQRVELLRYNPYDDTGGDQSFTCALLDDKGNGIIITSLHTRAGTRVFAKEVLEGKSGKHQFSKEEEEVIKKALMIKR